MNSDQLFEKSLQLVPGGVHSPVRSFKGLHTTPRFIKSAKGAYLTDEENKNYIDFCMSFGPMILGHQNPDVKKAIQESLEDGWTYGACERYSLEMAEYIIDRIEHIEQIRFMNSGTEAVMSAIRLARGITKKQKIIKFNGCYHGHMDSMLIKAGSGLAGTAEASSDGVPKDVASNTLVVELGDLDALESVMKSHKDDLAAVFIEPLPANNGLLIQSTEYLKGLRSLCDKYDCLLVFDEVISGFRVAFGGMIEKTGVRPDLVTYGKVIGGGLPVGAVAGPREFMEYLAPKGPVYQAGTLSANPAAMRAGLANLKQLTTKTFKKIKENTTNVVQILQDAFQKHGHSHLNIVQYESLFWITRFNDKGLAPQNALEISPELADDFHKLFQMTLERGVYLAPNGYEVGFVSLAHDEKVQEDLKNRLK